MMTQFADSTALCNTKAKQNVSKYSGIQLDCVLIMKIELCDESRV